MAASTNTPSLSLNLIERMVLINVIRSLPTPSTMNDVIAAGDLADKLAISDQEVDERGLVRDGEMLRWMPDQDFETSIALDASQKQLLSSLMNAGVWPYQHYVAVKSLHSKLSTL